MLMTSKEEQVYRIAQMKKIQHKRAKFDFWLYCKLMAPDFFKDESYHLHISAVVVQAFWENRIVMVDGKYKVFVPRSRFKDPGHLKIHIKDWVLYDDESEIPKGRHPRRFSLNVPPRHGKSRMMSLFVAWLLGKWSDTRVMVGSYNDDAASDFSKYTRNHIQEEKIEQIQNVFTDVFPEVGIDPGSSAAGKWALKGEPYSYIATGPNGSSTGKGANLLILDDIVKDAKTAFNIGETNKLWNWVTGTLLSRNEKDKTGMSQRMIIPMTRWPGKDPVYRFLKLDPDSWYVLALPVESDGIMLCDEIFSWDDLEDCKKNVSKIVWMANYYQEIVDGDDLLYPEGFKEYEELPEDGDGTYVYVDVADSGNDDLCCVAAEIKEFTGYVKDIYYTKEGSEVTEPEAVEFFIKNKVIYAWVESNNGGRRWARAVEEGLHAKGYYNCMFDCFYQSDNKRSRLLTNTTNVCNNMLYPKRWEEKYERYHTDLTTFPRSACLTDATLKAAACDAPDATTGFAEKMESQGELIG